MHTPFMSQVYGWVIARKSGVNAWKGKGLFSSAKRSCLCFRLLSLRSKFWGWERWKFIAAFTNSMCWMSMVPAALTGSALLPSSTENRETRWKRAVYLFFFQTLGNLTCIGTGSSSGPWVPGTRWSQGLRFWGGPLLAILKHWRAEEVQGPFRGRESSRAVPWHEQSSGVQLTASRSSTAVVIPGFWFNAL